MPSMEVAEMECKVAPQTECSSRVEQMGIDNVCETTGRKRRM